MFRPLKDTSPSSLPHNSTRSGPELSAGAGDIPNLVELPSSVPPKTTRGAGVGGEPSQPSDADDDDGSTLIGRATNIANTAKDLLGALWYGSQEEAGRAGPAARQHRRGASLG